MSAWDDFKASDLYKGDIEITDHLTNYDSVCTWSGDKATASFPQADPNDIADSPIIFNPGDYRSSERLYLLGGKYEVNGADLSTVRFQPRETYLELSPFAALTRS